MFKNTLKHQNILLLSRPKRKNTHLGKDLTRFKHSTDLVELFREEFSFTTVLAENTVIFSTILV